MRKGLVCKKTKAVSERLFSWAIGLKHLSGRVPVEKNHGGRITTENPRTESIDLVQWEKHALLLLFLPV